MQVCICKCTNCNKYDVAQTGIDNAYNCLYCGKELFPFIQPITWEIDEHELALLIMEQGFEC